MGGKSELGKMTKSVTDVKITSVTPVFPYISGKNGKSVTDVKNNICYACLPLYFGKIWGGVTDVTDVLY